MTANKKGPVGVGAPSEPVIFNTLGVENESN